MSGRTIHSGGHDCGWKPTARRAGSIWQCDDCGQRWIYRVADPIRGLSWRYERWPWPWNWNREERKVR